MKYILLLTVIITITGCFSREPEKTGREGSDLPSFKLLLADSVTYFDTKDISSGKPIVLFYFGPYCPYSKAQMEEILEDMSSLKEIQFYVFTNWPFKDMKKFYSDYQLNKYSNITTGIDYTNFFGDFFEAQGVPYMAIYDKSKKLNKAFIGKIYGSQIKKVALKKS